MDSETAKGLILKKHTKQKSNQKYKRKTLCIPNSLRLKSLKAKLQISYINLINLLIDTYEKDAHQQNNLSTNDFACPKSSPPDGTVALQVTISVESSVVECFLTVVHGTIKETKVISTEDVSHSVNTVSIDDSSHRQHIHISRVRKKMPIIEIRPPTSTVHPGNDTKHPYLSYSSFDNSLDICSLVKTEKQEDSSETESCDSREQMSEFPQEITEYSEHIAHQSGECNDHGISAVDYEKGAVNSEGQNDLTDENDDDNDLVVFRSSSGRPQRNVTRIAYRKRDLFTSDDEDDKPTPRKRRNKARNGARKAKESVGNDVAEGNSSAQKSKTIFGAKNNSDNSDYMPSEGTSTNGSSAGEESEHSFSNFTESEDDDDKSIDLKSTHSSHLKLKSVHEEMNDIVERRNVYASKGLATGEHVSSLANQTSTDNDLHCNSCQHDDTDCSECSEDIFLAYVEEFKNAKKLPPSYSDEPSFKKCSQVSTLLRYYAFCGNPESNKIHCSICGRRSYCKKIFLHMFCMHSKSTDFVEKCYATSLNEASRVKVLPQVVQPELVASQVLCMLCHKVFSSRLYAQHLSQIHGNVKALRSYWENFGADSNVLSLINQNILEVDYISGLYICNICAVYGLEILVNKTNVSHHIQAHRDIESKCELCQKTFDDMTTHIVEKHDQLALRCHLCDFLTVEKALLEEHMHVNHPFNLRCSHKECTSEFTSEGALRRHIVIEHLDTTEPNTNFRADGNKDQGLFGHKHSAKQAVVNIPCQFCDKIISTRLMRVDHVMGAHMETEHQELLEEIPKEFKFVCKSCNKMFFLKGSYKGHKTFCKARKTCSFEGCNAKLGSLGGLRSHIYGYHQERKCPTCKEVFSTGRAFHRHKNNAHLYATRNYVCVECGKGFKRPSALKVHSMIHSGEKPLKCDYCDFRGRQRNNISSHVKVHHKDKLQEYLERNKDAS